MAHPVASRGGVLWRRHVACFAPGGVACFDPGVDGVELGPRRHCRSKDSQDRSRVVRPAAVPSGAARRVDSQPAAVGAAAE